MAGSTGTGNRPIRTRRRWTGGAVAALVRVDDRVGTAPLNLTIGLVITGLVSGVGEAARVPDRRAGR